MKKNPLSLAAQERMAPGRLSRGGFLGTDDRPIEEIVAADQAALEQAGVSREQLADLVDDLHRRADAALEGPVTLGGGRVHVRLIEVMGRIPCPFACGFRTHKASLEVTAGDLRLTLTPMHAHLIRAHGFFQGKGSDFRVEPADLAALYRLCRE